MSPLSSRIAAVGVSLWLLCVTAFPKVSHAEYTLVAEKPQPRPYSGWLLASYLTAPLVAAGVAYALSGFDDRHIDGEQIALGVTLGVLLPSSVHLANHEPGLALRSLLLWPTFAVVGGVALGLVGLVGVLLFYHPDSYGNAEEEGDFQTLFIVGVAAATGFVLGGICWPIFDIADTLQRDEQRRRSPSVAFGLLPDIRAGGIRGVMTAQF